MKRRPKSTVPKENLLALAPDAATILQVKVWLTGISPMVWRRVLVPSSFTLRELHGVIQVAMGWEGSSASVSPNVSRCSGRNAARTCCFGFEHARLTARSGLSSRNGIRGLRTTTRTAPPGRLRREYPTKGHALL